LSRFVLLAITPYISAEVLVRLRRLSRVASTRSVRHGRPEKETPTPQVDDAGGDRINSAEPNAIFVPGSPRP
jgi:hypothetical protein